MEQQRHRVLDPVVGEAPRILILGTFPGLASRQAGQFYGFRRNHFWPILFAVCGVEYDNPDYALKLETLRRNHIALWDVVESCETDGSLDTEIKHPELVDLHGFLRAHPTIQKICFNGRNAANFAKRLGPLPVPTQILPSTSPANATYSYQRKLEAWREALCGVAEQR